MSTRVCGFCDGELEWSKGAEQSAQERGGNARYNDEFTCTGCGREFEHWVSERFSGDSEGWSVRQGGDWRDLPTEKWPRFR